MRSQASTDARTGRLLIVLSLSLAGAAHAEAEAEAWSNDPEPRESLADAADIDALLPCDEADDPHAGEFGDWGWGSGYAGAVRETSGGAGRMEAECAPAEALLFAPRAEERERPETTRVANRSARHRIEVVVAEAAAGSRTVLRQSGAEGGFSHAVEVRGDTLARRRLAWDQRDARPTGARGRPGWRLAGGDMTDTALRLWPRALPRRTLPAGWRPARGTRENPMMASAPVPQGFAAGVFGEGFSAYALRAVNPVTRTGETPWARAFLLRHDVAGASLALRGFREDPATHATAHATEDRPWRLSVHASHTRLARPAPRAGTGAATDTAALFSVANIPGDEGQALSERVFAAELASPRRGVELVAALSENDRAISGSTKTAPRGGLFGAVLRTRLTRPRTGRFDLDLTVRGRSAGWASAWDPALTAAQLDERFGARNDAPQDAAPRGVLGAGESRSALEWSGRTGAADVRPAGARLETWRAWNPEAATTRQGTRLDVQWRLDEARLILTALRRVRETASARTAAHAVRADGAQTVFPRARLTAWRNWNADGSRDAGLGLGAEPTWRPSLFPVGTLAVTVAPAFRGEWTRERPRPDGHAAPETIKALSEVAVRLRSPSGWSLDGAAEAPLRTDGHRALRWSFAVSARR